MIWYLKTVQPYCPELGRLYDAVRVTRHEGTEEEFRAASEYADDPDWRDDNHYTIMTEAEKLLDDQREERRKLEEYARRIIYKYHLHRMDDLSFVDAIHREIYASEDELYAMQEDGPCGGWGMSVHQYHDDRNYVREKGDEARGMLGLMRRVYPVLMAQYDEREFNS
jgi:hypothetical protein